MKLFRKLAQASKAALQSWNLRQLKADAVHRAILARKEAEHLRMIRATNTNRSF